jgi:thiol-disulfide isomerase/thioredoxin
MIMLERISWTVSIFIFFWLAHQWFHIYQRRRLQAITPLSTNGPASLIVVVSSHCAICPAQKKVVAQLGERYPPSLLHVITIDAETQAKKARELSVMTVPTTFLQAPDGTIVHINNGFVALAHLASQVDSLIQRNASPNSTENR